MNRKVQYTVPNMEQPCGQELELLRKTAHPDSWVRPLCSGASSLDPTLLGIFYFISFEVWLQTLFLLNFHLLRIKVGEKYQEHILIKKSKDNTSLDCLRFLVIWLITPKLWLLWLWLCTWSLLGLEFPLPHSPLEDSYFLHSWSKATVASVRLYLTYEVELGASRV